MVRLIAGPLDDQELERLGRRPFDKADLARLEGGAAETLRLAGEKRPAGEAGDPHGWDRIIARMVAEMPSRNRPRSTRDLDLRA